MLRMKLFITAILILMLLSACAPALATAVPQATIPATAVPAVPATAVPTAAVEPPAQSASAGGVSLDLNGLAQGLTSETVAAVPPTANSPYWEMLPQHTRLTLQGYPISQHLLKPQIFVYPVNELGNYNENAGKIASNLQVTLQNQAPVGPDMPFLPLFNAAQVLVAQPDYFAFQNGAGVRYLTFFSQGIVPVNNAELMYTYQGLTQDGKYYVSAVLPINHPGLPAGSKAPEQIDGFKAYLQNITDLLNQQPADSFTPSLDQLDAMLKSLKVE